ncbi:MAG: hypothetical protein M8357_01860 [Desulfobulbaceae bacterium]|nr:hypothetical protein [Desulfobulbaceae bacterium]
MRCPKCGFISFDLIESCVKCGKNIADAATGLHGTVAGVAPPVFLRMPGEEATVVDAEEPLDFGTDTEEETVDFSFDEESSGQQGEEVELNLGEMDDTAPEIDFGGETAGDEEAPEIDLGFDEEVVEEPQTEESIDISDLGPSEEVEETPSQEFLEEEPEATVEETAAAGAGQGLEDLKVEGIDLESTPGAPDSGKVMPSVKTGTALDDFDIDLGDLITSKKD